MFEPTFGGTLITFFGIPVAYVLLAAGAVLALIGVRWILRIMGSDPEPQSFYATADRGVGPSWIAIFGIALLGFAVIVADFVLVALTAAPGESYVNQLVLGCGGLLEALAAGLAIRRMWYRARR